MQNLASMGEEAPVHLPISSIPSIAVDAADLLQPVLTQLHDARASEERRAEPSQVAGQLDSVTSLLHVVREVRNQIESPSVTVCNNPYLLLLGPAGSGKTHLLCEMTRQRIERDLPAILSLGQAFQAPFEDVLEVWAHSFDSTSSGEELLCALDAYARVRSIRCLISFDAINEGHRLSWARGLPILIDACRRYPGVALVISCRTPFERILAPDPPQLGLTVVPHFGFPAEQQSDAVEKYFRGYGIPLPEVPLLEEEFSNPLFLKLFCEALELATVKDKHAQIKDITAGQKGMTFIFERFVRHKDKLISERLGTQLGLSWQLLKGSFAATLAERHLNTIPREEALEVVDRFQPTGMTSGTLLHALIEEDLLAEDVTFDEASQPQEVIRFTYQKFADHLIARHLLATQLNHSSRKAIVDSLTDTNQLGFYFMNENTTLDQINIVDALMIEFPTRIKNQGELLDFLKRDSFLIRLCEVFVEGLYWRDPKSISKSTGRWIVFFLKNDHLRKPTLNVLVALAVKPKHPFNASKLDGFLSKLKLVERDLFWTEYLRNSLDRGTPGRILVWAEHSASKPPSGLFAEAYIGVLKWFLTSIQRGFRDRATHSLFRLGLSYPETLFLHTLKSLSLNDPYVSDRMLAASYGVTMALWRSPRNADFQSKVLPRFAVRLFRLIFARRARYSTTHILSRDYARRTVDLAVRLKPKLLSRAERRLLTPPFHFGGIRRWGQSQDRDDGKYHDGNAPLGMDFRNYTIGRLVAGRSNYDDSHTEYQRVLGQIMWRIYNLGYTLDAFSAIDREIAGLRWQRSGPNEAGKTEKYGKKYAWIAFYELAGYRHDKGLLPYAEDRISDADIDPSFPEAPKLSKLVDTCWIDNAVPVREWMMSGFKPSVDNHLMLTEIYRFPGPWVLVDGFIAQKTDDKNIFGIFQGLLVRSRDAAKSIEILSSMEYPGNHNIPRPGSTYYTYAGEIPWADSWRHPQYSESIGAEQEKIEVTLPVCTYSWESYHSVENQLRNIAFPSKAIGEELALYVQIPGITMAKNGEDRVAVIPVRWGEEFGNYESMLFIRQDLLDVYLKRKDLVLILFVWGERRANYHHLNLDDAHNLEGEFEIRDVLHKQGFIYTSGTYNRFL